MTEGNSPAPATAITRYCLRCRYVLDGILGDRCPECGTWFDPNDPRTFGEGAPPTNAQRMAVRIYQFGTIWLVFHCVCGVAHFVGVLVAMWLGVSPASSAFMRVLLAPGRWLAPFWVRPIRGWSFFWLLVANSFVAGAIMTAAVLVLLVAWGFVKWYTAKPRPPRSWTLPEVDASVQLLRDRHRDREDQ